MIYNGTRDNALIGSCKDLPITSAHDFISPEEVDGLWFSCAGGSGGSESSKVKKGRQSFPSGHTAVLAYSMTYVVVYLQVDPRACG